MIKITPGDIVYLAAARVFCATANRMVDERRRGPLAVDAVYRCGEHTRLTAHGDGYTKIDASAVYFETA